MRRADNQDSDGGSYTQARHQRRQEIPRKMITKHRDKKPKVTEALGRQE